jgi:hypothetical protein
MSSESDLTALIAAIYEAGMDFSLWPQTLGRRPGFHYGSGPEALKGRAQSWLPKDGIRVSGKVPLLKLHGSVSWSFEEGRITHYLDCRPAFRGTPCIIAPVYEKVVRTEFVPIWRRDEYPQQRS